MDELKMTDSQILLLEYVRTGSESAFRELVSRYLGLVYSAALRLVGGDTQLAEDVSQTVFLHLARKAYRLPRRVMLGGWLHRDACYVARTLMRSERRRQKRERQATEMNVIEDHSEFNLVKIAPVLDEAINSLKTEERTAILLRFFNQQDFRAIGRALGTNEDAARKRVARAIEKLHTLLRGQGITMSVATLGGVLASETMIAAAPAGLAASIAGSALAGAGTAAGLSATLIKIGTMTKVQASVIGALVLTGAVTSFLIETKTRAALRSQDVSFKNQSAQIALMQTENERLANRLSTISSGNRFGDLLRLRNIVESLRNATNKLTLELKQKQHASAASSPGALLPLLQKKEEDRNSAINRMNFAKRWVLAFRQFADNHGDRFPSGFDEARQYLDKETVAVTNITEREFELLYQGSITNIINPSLLVVLRERQPRHTYDGKWTRGYGFADGHSEVALRPTADFGDWEKRHIIPSQPAQ